MGDSKPTETSTLIPEGDARQQQAIDPLPRAELPQIQYTTKLGDPFHIATIASATRISEYWVAVGVSLCLTAAFSVNVVVMSYPIRLFSQSTWDSAVPGRPVPIPEPIMQPLWRFISKDCIHITGVPIFPFLFFIFFYFVACFPPVVVDLLDLKCTRRFKTQPTAMPTIRDMRKALIAQIRTLGILAGPGLTMMYVKGGPWPFYGPPLCQHSCNGASLYPEAAPTLTEFFFHLACCLFLFDFTYGSWHYLHHLSRPLYRHVHQFHHTYYMPFAFVTQYADLVELLIVSSVSVLLPVAMGAHPLTQLAWTMSSIQLSVDAHSGYNFPLMYSNWFLGGPLILGLSGCEHHDRHHQRPRTNFFPFLSWGDRMLGTAWHGEKSQENEGTMQPSLK